MVALRPQFKIKCGLKQREFARVTYANFFEVGISTKYETPNAGGRSRAADAIKWRHDFFVGWSE